jgi:hypothetical protein
MTGPYRNLDWTGVQNHTLVRSQNSGPDCLQISPVWSGPSPTVQSGPVSLLILKLLVLWLPGYQVVVAEAGHNCGWLNVWLVELWQQAWLCVSCDYSIRSSHIAGQSHSSRSRCIENWIYDGKSGNRGLVTRVTI